MASWVQIFPFQQERTDTMGDLSKLTGMGSLHATSKRRRTDTMNDLSKLTGMGCLHATSKRRRTKKHMILGLGQPGQREKTHGVRRYSKWIQAVR